MFVADVLSAHLPELERACSDSEDSNPKLRMLEDILLTMIDKNQASYPAFESTLPTKGKATRWRFQACVLCVVGKRGMGCG